ncbi:MAG: hypothetical protein HQK64_03585 [Desulfamplus sp.]|nr:hypothetical protein [Desulfamplus sp.]MBF0389572.1 hypothetical protein [Desulfamplus sp.]
MTTIAAHTHVIQQSNLAHDATHNLRPTQPDPAHLQTQQLLRENIEQTTVISSDASSKVNVNTREKRRLEEEKREAEKKKRAKDKDKKRSRKDPDQPGNILNTVA